MTHYFLPVGEEIMWFNDDFVDHKLILMNEDNTTKIADLDLPANSSASYKFQQPGKYYYSSEIYPKIQGSIQVLDPNNISVEKITGLKNGIDVQLAWISSQITLEKNSVYLCPRTSIIKNSLSSSIEKKRPPILCHLNQKLEGI
jgi:hypothetical protein